MTVVIGLDLSLTATGYAGPDGCATFGHDGEIGQRLALLVDDITDRLRSHSVDLVVIEDLPTNPRFGGVSLGMVHGVVSMVRTVKGDWPPCLYVPPASLKAFATGKGNASKGLMLTDAVRRLGYSGSDDNEADALWLRALGHHLLDDPLVDLPATHTRALDKVRPLLEGITA